MSITINTSIASLQANREINKQSNDLKKQFDNLSSGLRVNKASDDAAGLAVAMDLLAEANLNSVASRNISDAVSVISIADGALESAGQITDRMSELAMQAANGTMSDGQRSALDQEYQQLRQELDRISQTTEFNGQSLLSENKIISLQAGTSGSTNSQITLSLPDISSETLKLPDNISNQANATSALDTISEARDLVDQTRGQLGAVANRFETAVENIHSSDINQREAASRIRDLDVAEASSNLVATDIRQQISTALGAQANQIPSIALQLLG